MSGSMTWFAGLCLVAALSSTSALAAPRHKTHATPSKTHKPSCCRAPAGTEVQVELAEPLSTKTQKAGDAFALRLAAPLVVNGQMLLRQGAPGIGQVIDSSRPGFGGKAAKLVLAAQYLKANGRHIPLQGLQLARAGRNNAGTASAIGLTGFVFAPLGLVGLAVRGGEVELPEGLSATAKLSSDVVLPSLGPAKAPPAPNEAASADEDGGEHSAIDVPPPPQGKGEVVFFRRHAVLSLGQWFKVRENGKALCKLTNGAYCFVVVDPGPHTYTAKFEPELNDHLTLQIDPGNTYYVEGTTSKALLVGAADLSPSDHESFADASTHLKPAPPVAPNGADDGPDDKTTDDAAATPEAKP